MDSDDILFKIGTIWWHIRFFWEAKEKEEQGAGDFFLIGKRRFEQGKVYVFPGIVQVFPRQIGCFLSIKAMFSEGKGIVFPAFSLRGRRFYDSEALKGEFLSRFSSRIFVRISLSR